MKLTLRWSVVLFWLLSCVVGLSPVSGSADSACSACRGSGTSSFTCFFCKGTGKNGSFKCNFCNGRMFAKCSSCGGSGQSVSSDSRPGSGTPAQPPKRECVSCRGSGTSGSTCFFCKGTGKNGSFKSTFCNGKMFSKCASCNGTGSQ